MIKGLEVQQVKVHKYARSNVNAHWAVTSIAAYNNWKRSGEIPAFGDDITTGVKLFLNSLTHRAYRVIFFPKCRIHDGHLRGVFHCPPLWTDGRIDAVNISSTIDVPQERMYKRTSAFVYIPEPTVH